VSDFNEIGILVVKKLDAAEIVCIIVARDFSRTESFYGSRRIARSRGHVKRLLALEFFEL
jgi:hypothetical protein